MIEGFVFSDIIVSRPEGLLTMMSQQDILEANEEGEPVFIDKDGGASINIRCAGVKKHFARHVAALRNA